MALPLDIEALNRRFEASPTEDILQWAASQFGPRAAIGTSFQGAGLVMMHLAKQHGLRFPVFTLDTGLLFPETLELKARLEEFLGLTIETIQPEMSLEKQAEIIRPELWKADPDLCCHIRKVQPLQKRLESLDCWITGLRREQAETRTSVQILEVYVADEDSGREMVKLNPMANWRREAVWDYLRKNQIPYNPLHDRGYRSIGCQPCTAKTGEGDSERAGRWTGFKKTECGIHTFMARKV